MARSASLSGLPFRAGEIRDFSAAAAAGRAAVPRPGPARSAPLRPPETACGMFHPASVQLRAVNPMMITRIFWVRSRPGTTCSTHAVVWGRVRLGKNARQVTAAAALAAGTAAGWLMMGRLDSARQVSLLGDVLALALTCGCPSVLACWQLNRWLKRASVRRAAARKARRAVLLRHSDPVAADVTELAARLDAYDGRFRDLYAAIDRAYSDAGLPPRDKAALMPRLTIVQGGQEGA